MEINKTLKIKEKYFNAILQLLKPFELRHEYIMPNSIVKLECENGRYLVFKSGECNKLDNENGYYKCSNPAFKDGDITFSSPDIQNVSASFYKKEQWYDDFVWNYINEKETYLIDIAEILEVK